MLIKVMGPVGSGKSTISKLLAEKLKFTYIPEFEDNDVKFFRMLNKRNKTQNTEHKEEFQYYTFEQAYRRQYHAKNAVIDVPVFQHFIMAKCSLNKESYLEYMDCYKNHLERIDDKDQEILTILLYIPFEESLNRIRNRGRKEEILSEQEIDFYKSFYDELFEYDNVPKGTIIIDDTKEPDIVVLEIFNHLIDINNNFLARNGRYHG